MNYDEPVRWAQIQQDWCSYKKGVIWTQRCIQDTHHVNQPSREAWNRLLPHGPQNGPTLPTPWFLTSCLHNCETIKLCCLSHPVCSTYGSPRKREITQVGQSNCMSPWKVESFLQVATKRKSENCSPGGTWCPTAGHEDGGHSGQGKQAAFRSWEAP